MFEVNIYFVLLSFSLSISLSLSLSLSFSLLLLLLPSEGPRRETPAPTARHSETQNSSLLARIGAPKTVALNPKNSKYQTLSL